jgi:hypothetical protein
MYLARKRIAYLRGEELKAFEQPSQVSPFKPAGNDSLNPLELEKELEKTIPELR